ncbi:MAG: HD domain-containing phosphohydrolase [Dictyoglomaceae bacterium]
MTRRRIYIIILQSMLPDRDRELALSLFDIVFSLSSTMDLVIPEIVSHSQRVAYISYSIAKELGFSQDKIYNIILAGMLHDFGLLSYKDITSAREFEFDFISKNPHSHSFITYYLLKDFSCLEVPANYIKYHHLIWDNGRGEEFNGEEVPIESHILHLADRIEVLIHKGEHILNQTGRIVKTIRENSGKMFIPYLVEAFYSLVDKEFFWLDLASNYIPNIIVKKVVKKEDKKLSIKEFEKLSEVLARTIDFKSQFTSIHSRTVARISEVLGQYLGFPEKDIKFLKISGLLHDIGKLAIPLEILEKEGTLNKNEWIILRSHPYNTYRILDNLKGLETIRDWSSYHHERLDGKGYPFHIKDDEIPLEAQIVTIADIFTALSEDRPYRKALNLKEVLDNMEDEVKKGSINSYLYYQLREIIDRLNKIIKETFAFSKEEYEKFKKFIEENLC